MTFSDRGGWWVVAQLALFALILFASWVLGSADPAALPRTAGTVLAVAGAALGTAGALPLGLDLSPYPAPTAGSRLRTRGVHSLVRHPIYGGVILFFGGVALRSGSALAVGLAAGLIPFFVAKVRREEAMLIERFPEYAAYRQRVKRRFVPFLA